MIAPKFPDNEKERQLEVDKYQILDTLPEESYDSITELTADICNTPISLITLLDGDRNFLKSHYGFDFNESPREISFCGHAINSESHITIIEDSRKDQRFHDNPLVTEFNAIFYASATLINSNGYKLGTLCVYDTKPRTLSKKQLNALTSLSKQVTQLFEQRYQNIKLKKIKAELEDKNRNLEKFANVISHDLKSPISNIISLTNLIESENENLLDKSSIHYTRLLKSSSHILKNYIDSLLNYFKNDISLSKKENISVSDFINEVQTLTDPTQKVQFELESDIKTIFSNKSALDQIFNNLITNAIKYNSKSLKKIMIKIQENESHYKFAISDNGNGIPNEYLDKVFNLFSIVGILDNDGHIGTGLGLASVKKIINKLGGDIEVTSKLGEGSTFYFNLLKFDRNN